MFGKIARAVFGVAKWSLAALGLVVVLLIWWLSGGKPAAPIDAKPAVEVPAVSPGQSCDCTAGGACEGPRGGRYCIKPDGGKRYMQQ